MAREFMPKVLTANDLGKGDVVYRDAGGKWVRNIANAKVFHSQETADAALEATKAEASIIVGAYLFDVYEPVGVPVPTHFREDFRAKGPSNYKHGKQEDGHV